MEQTFFLLHLVGLSLGLGGLLGQLVILSRFHDAEAAADRIASERMSRILIASIQEPGTYLAAASGVGLLWIRSWEPLEFGYLQFKLLFVFWVLLAARLMSKNSRQFLVLRAQCGEADSERLRALKDNHRMIGYVTTLAFLFILIFAIWKPL